MREKEILELIKRKAVDSIANFIGAYYSLDDEGDIDSLILVSETGEYNLDQLFKARTRLHKKNKNIPIYSPDELIGFIAQISEAYKTLQEVNIYHSDTKLTNLVYSKSKKKFLLIDFGVSKEIRPTDSKSKTILVKIEDYANAGTKTFNSPEKQSYWIWLDLKKNGWEFNKVYDPFKCDMGSLGFCLEKMLGIPYEGNSEIFNGKKYILEILSI